jgi:hypothetical protein
MANSARTKKAFKRRKNKAKKISKYSIRKISYCFVLAGTVGGASYKTDLYLVGERTVSIMEFNAKAKANHIVNFFINVVPPGLEKRESPPPPNILNAEPLLV